MRRENVKLILHVLCNKTMHGILNTALMVNKKLTKALKECQVVMNPSNPCAWNVEEIKKQLTLLFHVDGVLLAHAHPQAITKCMKLLDNLHGEKYPLVVTQ